MSYLYPVNKSKKQKAEPKDSTLMHLAQKENFAIFVLMGIKSTMKSLPRVVGIDRFCNEIFLMADMAINDIKDRQELRMSRRKNEHNKTPKS